MAGFVLIFYSFFSTLWKTACLQNAVTHSFSYVGCGLCAKNAQDHRNKRAASADCFLKDTRHPIKGHRVWRWFCNRETLLTCTLVLWLAREINDEPVCHAQPVPEAGEGFKDPRAAVGSQLQRTAGAAQEQPVRARHVRWSSRRYYAVTHTAAFCAIKLHVDFVLRHKLKPQLDWKGRKQWTCLLQFNWCNWASCLTGNCKIPGWWPHSPCCWA